MPAADEVEARRLWRAADAVCFDVDSTVIREEGVDQLASFLGKAEEVAQLGVGVDQRVLGSSKLCCTRQSMGGAMCVRQAVRRTASLLRPRRQDIVRFHARRRLTLSDGVRTAHAMSGAMDFREALRRRLSLLRPTQQAVRRFTCQQSPSVSPGISELVRLLHQRGTKVFLVSGGFRCLIDPVARLLDIPADNVTANRLLFDFDGNYMGFDESQPTSASGGKPKVVQRLIDEHQLCCVAMVGDGATDLEASPPAHVFIGYGGNVTRERVRAAAPWFVHDFQQLIDALAD